MKKANQHASSLAEKYPELAREWHPTKNGDLTPADVTCGLKKKAWWKCPVCGNDYDASIGNRVYGTGCPYCLGRRVKAGFNDLATKRPEIAGEWHPTKNGGLAPSCVTCGSNKKVWWKCPACGSDYDAVVAARVRGTGCPYCAGTKVKPGYNDLTTNCPALANEWHPTKNGDLTPSDVTCGSNRKVWWKCPTCGGDYEAVIANRTNGTGCPYCTGHRVKAGFNDLATRYPEVAREWHPTKNGDLTPSDVTCGTHKKIWWLCKEGHEWEASVAKRGPGGRGCPYCSNKKILPGYNDMASMYPELAAEWHPTKNDGLLPSDVTWGSNKKVWWLCSRCGFEYQAVINKRTKSGAKCPCCGPIAKKIKVGFNDLGTTNPQLAVEWHPVKNGELTFRDVSFGSNRKVWWKCPTCGGDYDAVIADRANGAGCPFCAGKRVKPGFNDLATRYPEVANEWHPTKNGDLTPSDVLPRSDKKYWWKCSRCGNEWYASPDSRINRMSCPECSYYVHTSFPEQAVLFYLKQAFPDAEGRNQDFGFEIDIYIPSICTAIEYDGFYYHGLNRKYGVADDEKDLLCLANGISLYRIREAGLEPTSTSITIQRRNLSNTDLDHCIGELLGYLGKTLDVSVDRDQSAILAQYNAFIHENSLQEANPELAAEWHPTKNGDLLPENVPAGSGKKAWWLCPVCHGEWQTRIVARSKGRGCPYCANQRLLVGFNDLATKNPQIAREWHPAKNGDLTPRDVMVTSNKKVWWLCQACGREWEACISSRTRYGYGCQKCGAKRGNATRTLNKIENGTPTLSEKYPKLAAEWHPTKNGDLTPDSVTYRSGLAVWWTCSKCGREWKQRIDSRTRHNAVCCTKCRGITKSDKQPIRGENAYKAELSRRHPFVEIIGEYINANTKISCKCQKCGHEWSVHPGSLLRQKYGCPNCANNGRRITKRKKPEKFKQELAQINPAIVPLEEYSTSHTKIRCRCSQCGNEWLVSPSKLLAGQGCPECAKKRGALKQKKSPEQFVDELKQIDSNIIVCSDYINSSTRVLCRCATCGREWKAFPGNLLRGSGCARCKRKHV